MQCESRRFGHSGCPRRYPATTVTAKNQRQTPTTDTNSRQQRQKLPTETSNSHRQRTQTIDTTNKIQTVNTDSSHCQNPHTLIIGQQTAVPEPQTGDAHSEKHQATTSQNPVHSMHRTTFSPSRGASLSLLWKHVCHTLSFRAPEL